MFNEKAVHYRLEWVRRYFGLSQKAFALDMGYWPSNYSVWLIRGKIMSRNGLVSLYRVFGVSSDFILYGLTGNLPEKMQVAWEARSYKEDWQDE